MKYFRYITKISTLFFLTVSVNSYAQLFLPPLREWKGRSEELIAGSTNKWITRAEKTGFDSTSTYQETIEWLKRLSRANPVIQLKSIGKSPEGREIVMVVISSLKTTEASVLKKSGKPLLLVQAGIHAGEIDGKDAGMMLLRDIATGNKKDLIAGINLLFIPILNVDGHERSSSFNRPNQRGPSNMGWRTNSQNLNLNRDYSKLDTKEVQSVIQVINEYDPSLYMDLHVTDGADYQYDVTYCYGGLNKQAYSPESTRWLETVFGSYTSEALRNMGHIPGTFLNAANGRDFSDGNEEQILGPNFSNYYGDIRHLPSVLVETHSLKPYKQRVLGTYVLLESAMIILAKEGHKLKEATELDKTRRTETVVLEWQMPELKKGETPDSMQLLGISSSIMRSELTGAEYIKWTGQTQEMKIANYKSTEPKKIVKRPRAYWIPVSNVKVIECLKLHGIKMEEQTLAKELEINMYRLKEVKLEPQPFEGRVQVNAKVVPEVRKQLFPAGSVRITTDQPLGDLVVMLMEPEAPASFFRWGFFLSTLQRTEYMETYVIEPMMKQMLDDSPALKKEFEAKKEKEPEFARDPNAIRRWFYSKSNYYDDRFLLYPVAREE